MQAKIFFETSFFDLGGGVMKNVRNRKSFLLFLEQHFFESLVLLLQYIGFIYFSNAQIK